MDSASRQPRNLTDLLAALSERHPDLFGGGIGTGGAWPTVTMLANTDPALLLTRLDAEATLHLGMDRKAQAAFVMGRAARAAALPLAALWLGHGVVPRLSPDVVALTFERHLWQRGDERGEAIRYHAKLDCAATECAGGDFDALSALRASLVDALAPLVAALRGTTGLGASAMWRLASDMLCYAFLHVGEALGDAERARAEALAIVRCPGSVLHNRRSGFQHVELADAAEPSRIIAEQWFITRGGCCRWYTCDEGDRCSVCVLRPAAEQQAMLRDHLRSQHQAAVG